MRTLRTSFVGLLLLSSVGVGAAGAQVAPPPAPCFQNGAPVSCDALSGAEARLDTWPMADTPAAGASASASTPVPRGVLSRPRFTG
jgi:hypothetical protein